MKCKLLMAALTLIATQTAVAAIADPFPCPTVAALKRVGVSSTILLDNGPTKEWAGLELKNQYNTGVDWSFIVVVRGLVGKDKNEILASTNSAISSLILEGGPYPFPRGEHPGNPENAYYCVYDSVNNSMEGAFAVTPIWNDKTSLLKLLKR